MRDSQRLIAVVRIDARSLDDGPLSEALGATATVGAALGVVVTVLVDALGAAVNVLDGDALIPLLADT